MTVVIAHRGHMLCVALALLLAPLLGGCVPDAATHPPPGGAAAKAAPTPRPWIGIITRQVQFDPAAGIPGARDGMLVDVVVPGTPADAAGLREGDVIVALGGEPTPDGEALTKLVGTKGDIDTTIDVVRDGRRETLSIKPAIRPDEGLATQRMQTAVGARLAAERKNAQDAEAAGDTATAFRHHVAAMRLAIVQSDNGFAPQGARVQWDETLARIAALLPKLGARPQVPTEAERHNTRAITILRSAQSDADNDRAYASFRGAIYHAPWLPDLWLNGGLVLEKAGYAELAQDYLRRYLILNPQAGDAAQVRQKMAALDVMIEDRKPWLAYVNLYPFDDGRRERISIRGRTITITADTGSVAGADRADRKGDLIAQGTIRGRAASGKWINRPSNPNAVRCFSPQWETDADFAINPADGKLTVTIWNETFGTESCAVTGRTRHVTRTFPPRQN